MTSRDWIDLVSFGTALVLMVLVYRRQRAQVEAAEAWGRMQSEMARDLAARGAAYQEASVDIVRLFPPGAGRHSFLPGDITPELLQEARAFLCEQQPRHPLDLPPEMNAVTEKHQRMMEAFFRRFETEASGHDLSTACIEEGQAIYALYDVLSWSVRPTRLRGYNATLLHQVGKALAVLRNKDFEDSLGAAEPSDIETGGYLREWLGDDGVELARLPEHLRVSAERLIEVSVEEGETTS